MSNARDLPEVPAAARAVLEASPQAIVLTDRLGRIVLVNVHAERMFRYDADELLGREVEVLMPEAGRERHVELRNRFNAEERVRPLGAPAVDLWGRRKDGTTFPLEIGLSRFEAPDGVLVMSFLLDISARRQLEAKYKNLIESAPDAIVLMDPRGRITLVNAQTERLFGYRREELIGELVEALIPKRFRAAHPGHRNRYFANPRPRPMGSGLELFGLRKDGTEIPIEISLSPFAMDDGMWAMSAIREITERKRLEQERIRLAQAEEAVRIRDEFLSIAAHELRTPLTALQLQLQGLEQVVTAGAEGAEIDPVRVTRKVEKVSKNAGRLNELVDALLDVSRIASGRLILNPVEVDLAAMVREVVDDYRDQARQAGCELVLEHGSPVKGSWDRYRLEQVLLNLLTNATKYGAGLPVVVRVFGRAGAAVFSVTDHGMGIAAEDAERIFHRFERAVSSKHYGGMGLGLYIARHLVQAHGGTIEVESSPGAGATFTVELPVARGALSRERGGGADATT